MKKHLSPALLLVVLAFFAVCTSSCDKTNNILFEIPYTVENFTAGPYPVGGSERILTTEDYQTNLEAQLNEYGASLDNIDKVVLKDMTITALDGTFDGLDYASAWLRVPGLDDVQVGFFTAIPQTGLTSITLEPQYDDLSEHLKQPNFEMYAKTYSSSGYPATNMSATFVVEVTATTKD